MLGTSTGGTISGNSVSLAQQRLFFASNLTQYGVLGLSGIIFWPRLLWPTAHADPLLYSTLRFPWLVETIPSKSQKPKKELLVEKQANYLFPAFLLEKPSAFNIFDPHGCLEKGGWLQE